MRVRAFTFLMAASLSALIPVHAVTLVANADDGINTSAAGGSSRNGHDTQIPVQSPSQIALIRFDATNFPTTQGSKATLTLSIQSVPTEGPINVLPILSAWSEATVTGNTKPAIGTAPIATFALVKANAGQQVQIDITTAVNSWIANPASNFGIAIVGAANPRAYAIIKTRESGAAPKLAVGPPSVPNETFVEVSGGNYADPVAAANNAYQGDKWCVSPSLPDHPCILHIGVGSFHLNGAFDVPAGIKVVGHDKGESWLIGSVETAGVGVANLNITGLGALDSQFLVVSSGSFTIENSSIDGGVLLQGGTLVTITDSDVSGRVQYSGALTATNTILRGGIYGDTAKGLTLRNCQTGGIEYWAGSAAVGSGNIDVEGGTITNTSTAQFPTVTIEIHDFTRDILIVGANIRGSGAAGEGGGGIVIDRDGPGSTTLDGVYLEGGIADDPGVPNNERVGTLTILRSRLLGSAVTADKQAAVDIRESLITKGNTILYAP